MSQLKILRASAGSGKTFRLAYEYIERVVRQPHTYRSILAVTFTNKATEQMKRRILEQLNMLTHGRGDYLQTLQNQTGLPASVVVANAKAAQSLILHDYSRFSISTIDKFFQRIVRSFFRELDLDFSYEVEVEGGGFIAQAVEQLMAKRGDDPALDKLISYAVQQQLDQDKGWDIRRSLTAIARDIVNEDYTPAQYPAQELLDTFNEIKERLDTQVEMLRRKCGQALEIISQAGLDPLDFKQGRNSFASYFARIYGSEALSAYNSYYRAAIDNPESWVTAKSPNKNQIMALEPTLWPMIKEVGALWDEIEPIEVTFRLVEQNFASYLLMGAISKELDALWSQQNSLPLFRTARLIAQIVEQSDIPFIYEKIGTRYGCYMIDEFQDTSRVQWHGFVPLIEEALSKDDQQAALLIGDVKQAIYRWRGGDWDILARRAAKRFERQSDTTEQLSTNWRSLPNVVEFNNNFIDSVVQACTLKIEALLEQTPNILAEFGGALQNAYRDFEQKPSPRTTPDSGYVEVAMVEDANAKVIEVVVDALERGYTLRDIAILVRYRSQGEAIAKLLVDSGYEVISEQALRLSACGLIKLIVAMLRLALDKSDVITRHVVEMYLAREITPQELSRLSELSLMTPVDAVERIVHDFELGSRDVSYLQGFYQAIFDFCNANYPDIKLFLDWWDDKGKDTSLELSSSQDAITVNTIHKAKGLEYPCVIIPYADWELLPKSKSTLWVSTDVEPFAKFNPVPISIKKEVVNSLYRDTYLREVALSCIDNVNLLYVAVTRARDELYIFAPEKAPKESVAEFVGLLGNYTFGTKPIVVPESVPMTTDSNTIVMSQFHNNEVGERVRVNWRYGSAQPDDARVAPRARGILLHDFFAKIKTLTDMKPTLDAMLMSGSISPQQAQDTRSTLDFISSNDTIKDWFSDRWELFSERDIIARQGMSRPDRVMVFGNQAVVVDYKFGVAKLPSHKTQVQNYMLLLQQMGYTSVHGFLWYVELQEVDEL